MSGKQYHIALDRDMLCGARCAIMPGDPARVEKIAAYLNNPRFISQSREYTSWLGEAGGQPVVVTSHGIGGPSTAIAVEELSALGVDTFIRVGTCGGMNLKVLAGDAVIVNGAIRAEGTSREYLPIEFPAIADIDVTCALREAAKNMNCRFHIGVAQCKDSFYGQHDPDRMPVSYELLNKWQAWIRAGALVSEMETAALFAVASCLGARAGAVMLCIWNQERERAGMKDDNPTVGGYDESDIPIKIAVGAIKKLIG
ncbi:MAG: nucleoside phosphorylase [Oscillospiraceae bacterium]